MTRPHSLRLMIRKLLVCACGHTKYWHVCAPIAGGCLMCECDTFDLAFYKRGAAR